MNAAYFTQLFKYTTAKTSISVDTKGTVCKTFKFNDFCATGNCFFRSLFTKEAVTCHRSNIIVVAKWPGWAAVIKIGYGQIKQPASSENNKQYIFRCKLKFNLRRAGKMRFGSLGLPESQQRTGQASRIGPKIGLEIRFGENLGCEIAFLLYPSQSTFLQDRQRSYRENMQVSAKQIKEKA